MLANDILELSSLLEINYEFSHTILLILWKKIEITEFFVKNFYFTHRIFYYFVIWQRIR